MGIGRLTEPLLTQLVHETRLKRVMVLGISGTMEGWKKHDNGGSRNLKTDQRLFGLIEVVGPVAARISREHTLVQRPLQASKDNLRIRKHVEMLYLQHMPPGL